MTIRERLQLLVDALPSDEAAVVLTRASIMALLGGSEDRVEKGDMTVDEVARETRRAPSTVRGWLADGMLRGYKLNGRDWRIPQSSLETFLAEQRQPRRAAPATPASDIAAWRSHLKSTE